MSKCRRCKKKIPDGYLYCGEASKCLIRELAAKEAEIKALREALEGLKVDPPSGCYCDAQFGAMRGAHPQHSDECKAAKEALEATK